MSGSLDATRVAELLRLYKIVVDEPTAAALADEATTLEEQMAKLLDYDLTTVNSAVELTRRGRR